MGALNVQKKNKVRDAAHHFLCASRHPSVRACIPARAQLLAPRPARGSDGQRLTRLDPRAQHISVGRCRMLAINYGVALPPYEVLSQHGFMETRVPAEEWIVPDDCKRFLKKLAEEGLCYGRCATCEKLVAKQSQPQQEAPAPSRVSQRPRGEGLVTRREAALREASSREKDDPVETGGIDNSPTYDPSIMAYPLEAEGISLDELEECVTSALELPAVHGALLESALLARALGLGGDDDEEEAYPTDGPQRLSSGNSGLRARRRRRRRRALADALAPGWCRRTRRRPPLSPAPLRRSPRAPSRLSH